MSTLLKLLLSVLCLSYITVGASADQALEALDKDFLEFLSLYVDADEDVVDQVFDIEAAGNNSIEESSSDESK